MYCIQARKYASMKDGQKLLPKIPSFRPLSWISEPTIFYRKDSILSENDNLTDKWTHTIQVGSIEINWLKTPHIFCIL